MKLKFIPVAMVVMAAAAIAFAQEATLKWTPKEGTTTRYKMESVGSIEGMGEFEMSATISRKVLSTQDGKIVVEEKQSDVKLSAGGQDMSSMIPEAPVVTATYDMYGEVLDRKLSKPSEMDMPRLEALMAFVYPKEALTKGKTWTRKMPANKAKGTYTMEATYTYVGTEMVDGVNTYKITQTAKETDAPTNMTIDGTLWISAADGDMVKAVQDVKNVEFQEGMPPMNMKATMTRIR